MRQIAKPLFLQCETALHAGSGSELGIVDLPIQRERHTGFPKIEGSSLKGALREHFTDVPDIDKNLLITTFGTDTKEQGDNAKAGAIGITDARLLLFPVKSVKGVFAYITCPRVLNKFCTDLAICDSSEFNWKIPTKNSCASNTSLRLNNGAEIILEQYAYKEIKASEELDKLGNWLSQLLFGEVTNYWSEKIKNDIVVLSDDDFSDFVQLSTEVITRTKIDPETGAVETGALFTEEYLPTESILYSLILTRDEFLTTSESNKNMEAANKEAAIRSFFNATLEKDNIVQLGGNATLGKGILKAVYLNNSPTT